jgi:hypothetical protein
LRAKADSLRAKEENLCRFPVRKYPLILEKLREG